jgi:hypothetical protein
MHLLRWFRRRQAAAQLVEVDADALVRGHGGEAYRLARTFERDVVLSDGTTHQGRTSAHWRRVALFIAKRATRAVSLSTATRMANRR